MQILERLLTLPFENVKTEKCFDNGKVSDVLLTDLSKAFGSLEHELLTAKSNVIALILQQYV